MCIRDSNNSLGIDVEGRFQVPDNFELPYNKNSIQFDFIGINLGSSRKVKYKWKLEGFDNKWSKPVKRHNANYTNLPPGDYIFQVIACNENNYWNTEPTTVEFKITKPYWLKSWFIASSTILTLVFFALFSQARVKRLRKAKLVLEKEIEMATVELRQEKEFIEKQNNEIALQKDQLFEINMSFVDSVNSVSYTHLTLPTN